MKTQAQSESERLQRRNRELSILNAIAEALNREVDLPPAEIFNAIRVVHAGGSLLQPIVTSKLMLSLEHDGQSQTPAVEPLTDRESEMLGLLARGKTNKEITAALYISERRVKFHVSAIIGKLGAGNRTEAIAAAAQRGLVKLS